MSIAGRIRPEGYYRFSAGTAISNPDDSRNAYGEAESNLTPSFPGSVERTASEAPPYGTHRCCPFPSFPGSALERTASEAPPHGTHRCCSFPSFPGSALERTAPEAPPHGTHRCCSFPSFPGSALERTASEAPPHGTHRCCSFPSFPGSALERTASEAPPHPPPARSGQPPSYSAETGSDGACLSAKGRVSGTMRTGVVKRIGLAAPTLNSSCTT